MNLKYIFTAAVFAIAGTFATNSVAANSDSISFDNFTVTYNHMTYDKTSIDGTGVGFGLSKTINDLLYVTAGYDRFGSHGVDLNQLGGALGVRYAFGGNAVAYGEVQVSRADVDFVDNEWVYGAELGVRYALNNKLEFRGGVNSQRVDGGLGEWTTYGVAGTTIKITDNVAFVADALLSGYDKRYQAGLQYQF